VTIGTDLTVKVALTDMFVCFFDFQLEGYLGTVQSTLQSALTPLVEQEMEEAYRDLWKDIVYRKPPWSAYDIVSVLHK
jgi:hypothetical protein